MGKISLEEWLKKYYPLELVDVKEYERAVYLVFRGRDRTLWEVVIGVYGDRFCVAGECYSLLVEDKIRRCSKIPNGD